VLCSGPAPEEVLVAGRKPLEKTLPREPCSGSRRYRVQEIGSVLVQRPVRLSAWSHMGYLKASAPFCKPLMESNSRFLFRANGHVPRSIRVPAHTVTLMRYIQGRVVAHRHVAKTLDGGRWYLRESRTNLGNTSLYPPQPSLQKLRLKLYALSLIARRGVLYALMSCQFECILSLVGAVILLVSHFVLHCTPRIMRPIKDARSLSSAIPVRSGVDSPALVNPRLCTSTRWFYRRRVIRRLQSVLHIVQVCC
jgi:hypothetical protein